MLSFRPAPLRSGILAACALAATLGTAAANAGPASASAFLLTAPRTESSNSLIFRVTVPRAGIARITATRISGDRRITVCPGGSVRFIRATSGRLGCQLNAATRAARASGPVRVRACVTFARTGGTPTRKCRTVTFTATGPAYAG